MGEKEQQQTANETRQIASEFNTIMENIVSLLNYSPDCAWNWKTISDTNEEKNEEGDLQWVQQH